MTRILAWLMVFALLNVITICPIVASGTHAASPCCPHSKGPQIPCTESTANNCPYVLLEKPKSERGVPALVLAAIPAAVGAPLHTASRLSVPHFAEFLAHRSDSYLSHRVLRL